MRLRRKRGLFLLTEKANLRFGCETNQREKGRNRFKCCPSYMQKSKTCIQLLVIVDQIADYKESSILVLSTTILQLFHSIISPSPQGSYSQDMLFKFQFLTFLCSAAVIRHRTGGTCNSGSLQCCDSLQSTSSDNSGTLLSGLVPVNLQGLTGSLGLDCTF